MARISQSWAGNNRFLLGGRLIFGPDVHCLLLSALLITAPSAALCCMAYSKIAARAAHHVAADLEVLALATTAIIAATDLFFLFMTAARDPGFMPRNARPRVQDVAFESHIFPLETPRTKEVVNDDGVAVEHKYCSTCLLYRPPRTSHCSICDNCVQRFDHHCPWVGQCIGLRNYRYFFLFLLTSTLLCMTVLAFSTIAIIKAKEHLGDDFRKFMQEEALLLALAAYAFTAAWFVGGLTVYHTYLISRNLTTHERLKNQQSKKDNPYRKSIWNNFREVFFAEIPPSLIDFRAEVPEDAPDSGRCSTSTPDLVIDTEKIAMLQGLKIPIILLHPSYKSFDIGGKDDGERPSPTEK